MTWIIFDNVHVWKLIHVCYTQVPNLELDSLLSGLYGSVWTKKKLLMGCIEQILTALLFGELHFQLTICILTNKIQITREANESILRSRGCILRYAYAR